MGAPKWRVYSGKKNDNLGVPPFRKPPYIIIHITQGT